MQKVLRVAGKSNRKKLKHAKIKDVLSDQFETMDSKPLDSQFLLISALLPPAVKEFIKECEREVDKLCGERYRHGKVNQRWGNQNGSVIIANQRVAVQRPRVRNKITGEEVEIETYEEFQDPKIFDQAVFTEGLRKVSQRDYEKGVSKIANSFGFKKSSVSRHWIKATANKIKELQSRSLKEMDIRAVFIDGKRFGKYGVIIALGVASSGMKHVLGIYQASGEDHQSCLNMLLDLETRGLPSEGLLFIVDGGSGLNKALDLKYFCHDRKNRKAIRIRCHAHKWRNLESALGDESHKALGLFWALRDAKDMTEAKNISDRLESVLRDLNLSALHSYQEAKEDLLAVHELKLSFKLKRFFSTTNAIESLNYLIEEDMRRVKKWKDSEHFQRWLATYCLSAEKKMRRIHGHNLLPALWIKLRSLTEERNEEIIDNNQVSA
jgi:transposase-like protein